MRLVNTWPMTEIMIIGGGIGGLALAQALRRAEVPVRVFEKTHERTDWLQGYRIHLNPVGAAALRECLDPAQWQQFLDTVWHGAGGFGFMTEKMRTLLEFPGDIFPDHYGVSRTALREVLLSSMEGTVMFGKAFSGYRIMPGGKVKALFDDGSTAVADVLIGADGANSKVRGQLLPHAHRIDTGISAIAGRFPWASGDLAPELTRRSNIVIPAGPGSMFTATWGGKDPYTFWAFADASKRFPDSAGQMDGKALRAWVLERMSGWAPGLRHLAGECDPATVNLVRVRSATPVKGWKSGPVTLLGDAIHHMTPMAGIGANIALRDADLLRRKLIGASDVIAAIREYEQEMLGYGFAAVRRSLRNAQQAGSSHRLARHGFRGFLRLAAAAPPIRKAMAAGLGS
jgi:salicylate hydroxylase